MQSYSAPKLSIILPVYNGQEYLGAAIESVLSQSCCDFELIIINDGSSDGSVAIIDKLEDPRVRFFQQSNKGLAVTLNRGVSLARGEYIARQDQDDVSFPTRFELQVSFLDGNADVGMVGTAAEIWVDNERTNRLLLHPTDNTALKFSLLFDNYFVHSSIMIRRSVFENVGGYTEDFTRQPPEDYELWSRVMRKYQLANLPDVLMAYREVEGSMSRTGGSPFFPNLMKISKENLAWALGCSVNAPVIGVLVKLTRGVYDPIPDGIGFTEINSVLSRAAISISGDAGCVSPQLDRAVRMQMRKLRYHYFNYRCGGLLGKLFNSRVGTFVKRLAERMM